MTYFQPYLPNPGELASLAACAVVLLGFLAIGALFRGEPRPGLSSLLSGWGLAAVVPSLLVWIWPLDLRWYAAGLGLLAVAAAVARRQALARSPLWRPAVLFLPALVVACGVPLDEWDSFSHWGLNAAWLWRHDAFPTPSLPQSPSSHPDYPYAYPLALYMASLLRGAYIENAGAIVNLMVLLAASTGVARLAAGDDGKRLEARPWFWSACGVYAVLVLNPGFVRSTTLATYADTVFAACVMALVLALWRLTEAKRTERAGAWFMAASLALALVGVKEGGLPVLGVTGLALAILSVRDRLVRARLVPLLGTLVPAALAAIAWEQWTGWLPSSFSVMPLDQWRFGQLGPFLRSAVDMMAEHALYYLLLAVVMGAGAVGWWRACDARDRLFALAGLIIAGHLTTILVAYLGAGFTEAEVAGAVSLHRYTTQVGLLAVASAVFYLGHRAASRSVHPGAGRRDAIGRLVVAACVIVMLVGSPYLHREHTDDERFFLRHGHALSDDLPANSRVGLAGWREMPYAYFLLRYALYRPGRDNRGLELERIFKPLAEKGRERERQLRRLAARKSLTHLLVIGRELQGKDGPDMLLFGLEGQSWRLQAQWHGK